VLVPLLLCSAAVVPCSSPSGRRGLRSSPAVLSAKERLAAELERGRATKAQLLAAAQEVGEGTEGDVVGAPRGDGADEPTTGKHIRGEGGQPGSSVDAPPPGQSRPGDGHRRAASERLHAEEQKLMASLASEVAAAATASEIPSPDAPSAAAAAAVLAEQEQAEDEEEAQEGAEARPAKAGRGVQPATPRRVPTLRHPPLPPPPPLQTLRQRLSARERRHHTAANKGPIADPERERVLQAELELGRVMKAELLNRIDGPTEDVDSSTYDTGSSGKGAGRPGIDTSVHKAAFSSHEYHHNYARQRRKRGERDGQQQAEEQAVLELLLEEETRARQRREQQSATATAIQEDTMEAAVPEAAPMADNTTAKVNATAAMGGPRDLEPSRRTRSDTARRNVAKLQTTPTKPRPRIDSPRSAAVETTTGSGATRAPHSSGVGGRGGPTIAEKVRNKILGARAEISEARQDGRTATVSIESTDGSRTTMDIDPKTFSSASTSQGQGLRQAKGLQQGRANMENAERDEKQCV
jgi:hypothetical protein